MMTHIWNPLRDPKQSVREAAATALGSILDLIGTREYEQRRRWYKALFQTAMREMEPRAPDNTLHASLLAIGEQINHHGRRARREAGASRSSRVGVGAAGVVEEKKQDDFMLAEFRPVGQKVLGLKDHRTPIIRSKVIELLPCLARFHPEAFCAFYMVRHPLPAPGPHVIAVPPCRPALPRPAHVASQV